MFDAMQTPGKESQVWWAESASGELRMPTFPRGALCAPLKRSLDVAGSLVALAVLSPLLVAIAAAIAADSPGPILFRQRRTGRAGQVFTIYKFRTMTVIEDGETIRHATRDDQRVTRLGRFLRSTSLDELPQLFNVCKGDMSLVGPRPHALAHDLQYAALIPSYPQRFAVRPGLTGLAQVNGLRGEIHELSCMGRRVDADVLYAKSWSFLNDLVILGRTVPLLWKRVNAY